jgi:hypothetical protein
VITPAIDPVVAGAVVGSGLDTGYAGADGTGSATADDAGSGDARSAAQAGSAAHAVTKRTIAKKTCANRRA